MEIFHAVQSVLGKLSNLIEQDSSLTRSVKNDLRLIKNDMAMVNSHIKVAEDGNCIRQDAVEEQWILQLQDLAYDIEDSIDSLYRKPKLWILRRGISMIMGTDHRPGFINEVQSFKERIISLQGWRSQVAAAAKTATTRTSGNNTNTIHPEPPCSSFRSTSPSATSADLHRSQRIKNTIVKWVLGRTDGNQENGVSSEKDDDSVGIEQPKQELLDLLLPAYGGDGSEGGGGQEVVVASIVGPDGLGKITLAKAVFDSMEVAKSFPDCRLWAVASDHPDETALLMDLLCKVDGGRSEITSALRLEQIRQKLRSCLKKTRYFVVIDDMPQAVSWLNMESALIPKTKSGGRVIVTTSVQSVANACSRGRYVYKMQGLNWDCSQTLFWKNVFRSGCTPPAGSLVVSPDLLQASEDIFHKCDGSPLALVNIAQCLFPKRENLTGKECQDLSRMLGTKLAAGDCGFEEMNRVLLQCYNSLHGHGPRSCLLSLSMFYNQGNHLIKTKRLVRRWLAEGFVIRDVQADGFDVARERFNKLIDQSILDPVEISYNSEVKSSRVPGVMMEFLVHKSISRNFFTLIHKGKIVRRDIDASVRRVPIQDDEDITKEQTLPTIKNIGELTHIRSLTVTGCHIVDNFAFKKKILGNQECIFLRLLDLEKCTGLTADILRAICNQWRLLKYLSIRDSDAEEIPENINKLQCLETLDIRGTKVQWLLVEVSMLPMLLHIFGMFKLPSELKTLRGLSNSILQTLAGFFMDYCYSFEQLFRQMKLLRKVKICCLNSPSADLTKRLASCLQRRFEGKSALESLSIDFGDNPIDFLDSLTAPGMLSSIKLRGKLTTLPNFITSLEFLSELHLMSTGLSIEAISVLQNLSYLVYLRVVEEEDRQELWDKNFVVQPDGFPSLHRLCLSGPKLPKVEFKEGAMRSLTSLYLLCPDIGDDGIVGIITYLQNLTEVVLHHTVTDAKLKAWQEATTWHKNRPRIIKEIKKQKRGN